MKPRYATPAGVFDLAAVFQAGVQYNVGVFQANVLDEGFPLNLGLSAHYPYPSSLSSSLSIIHYPDPYYYN